MAIIQVVRVVFFECGMCQEVVWNEFIICVVSVFQLVL